MNKLHKLKKASKKTLKPLAQSLKEARSFTLGSEEALKQKIMEILINKDNTHGSQHHAKYAKRLQDFQLEILPYKKYPDFAAAISYETGIIYIGEGVLYDDAHLDQLGVLVRHELAHNLLMHVIRMTHKLGKHNYNKISAASASMHDLLNRVMDFEISNRKYLEEDKAIVRKIYIAGDAIRGLVTEDFRTDWIDMSVEEMYDAITKEIGELRANLVHSGKVFPDKLITNTEVWPFIQGMADATSPSIIWEPIETYFDSSATFEKYTETYQKMFFEAYAYFKDRPMSEIDKIFKAITQEDSENLLAEIKVTDDYILTTPEEKYATLQVLKYLKGMPGRRPRTKVTKAEHSAEYKALYNDIIKKFGKRGEYSIEEIGKIINSLNAMDREVAN